MRRLTRIAAAAAAMAMALCLWQGAARAASEEVRLRIPSFALNLHPLRMTDSESRSIATLLHVGLVFVDRNGDTRPLLAREWTRSGKDWEFVLRRGMTFSNGDPVTAEDVVASLCAAMQPTSTWAWALAGIAHVREEGGAIRCTGIAAAASDRVRIAEDRPSPWLLDALSGPAGWILPASNPKPEAFGVMPGAGPYRVREIVPDSKVVLEARREGSPVRPGVETIRFDYMPDDLVAAQRFADGSLHVLDLGTPRLVEAILDGSGLRLRHPGRLVRADWDRVRIAIVNEKALAARGFSADQIRGFIDAFGASVDRDRIAAVSKGIGEPLSVPFLPVPRAVDTRPSGAQGPELPDADLTIVTEPDPYSDLIAASMPRSLGKVGIGYKGLEKGLLIDSLIKGKYDIAIVPIEATVRSPAYWKNFFTPGSALTLFGKPIAGLEDIDVAVPAGAALAAREIAAKGNWVAIIRERRLQAIAPGVSGIVYTATGQTNYAFIERK